MQGITTCLWFDGRAEEAMNFYLSIFPDSKTLDVSRYGESGPGAEDSVMTVVFELNGQKFMGLNGGPHYSFTPAISFVVNCQTQAEIDTFWQKLSEGGATNRCGWLTDKFGVSWQIVPAVLAQMMTDVDPEKSNRVMQALLTMTKLDIAALERAYRQ